MAGSRILVLGATGMLGHQAIQTLAGEGEVHATVRDRAAAERHSLPAELHELDATAPEGLEGVLAEVRPEVVLNCIGLVKQRPEAADPLQAIPVNSLFPHLVAEATRAAGAWLVHVSTDCVFSGELEAPGRYREDAVPDARDLYGRSKLLGEVDEAPALTIRTSIIGRELERASGLLAWLEGQAGRSVRGFTEAWFSGLTTRALSELLATLIREGSRPAGLYHVASEPISKYELVTRLNEALGLGCTVEPLAEPRVNRALDGSRFEADTGVQIPGWQEMIEGIVKEPEHEPLAR